MSLLKILNYVLKVLKGLFDLLTMCDSNNIAFMIGSTNRVFIVLLNRLIVIVVSVAGHKKALVCSSASPNCSTQERFHSFAFNESLNSETSSKIARELRNTLVNPVISH